MDLAGLLAALGNGPNLHGAACALPVNRVLFDRALERGLARHAGVEAAQICAVCPALRLCRDWLDGLPVAERPVDVIAGVRVGVRRSSAA